MYYRIWRVPISLLIDSHTVVKEEETDDELAVSVFWDIGDEARTEPKDVGVVTKSEIFTVTVYLQSFL